MWTSILCVIVLFKAANGLQCHNCSSDKLKACATLNLKNFEQLPITICEKDATTCFTKIENGVTIRGCSPPKSDSSFKTWTEWCEANDCDECLSDECNGEIFPENRLSCIHCEGIDCVNQTNAVGVRFACANYKNDDECYSVYAHDGQSAFRGCMSDDSELPGKSFCLKNRDQCHKCSTPVCNDDVVVWEKPISCVKCTSEDNEKCVKSADQISSTKCVRTAAGYKGQCYTREINQTIERGCFYEATEEVQNECEDSSKSCKTCNKSGCNKDIAYLDEYCYRCDSIANPNCRENVDPQMEAKCSFTHKGCYLIRQNDNINKFNNYMQSMFKQFIRVRRGCISDLEEFEIEKCLSGVGTYCKTCEGINCNQKIKPLDCVRCNSELDENCKLAPTKMKSIECEHYDDKCVTIIHKNETMVRDCLRNSAIEERFCIENPWLCKTCETDNCNTIATIDKYCYECNSKQNPDCLSKLDDLMNINCPFSATNPGCYHFINETGSSVQRGCLADLSNDELQKCKNNDDECKTCQKSACNSRKTFQQCSNGSIDLNGKSHGFGKKICHDYNDHCFMFFEKDAVTRGCLQEYIVTNNLKEDFHKRMGIAMYRTCATPMCNDDEIETEFCINCSSDTDPDCKNNVTSKNRKKCNLAETLMGCYHYEDLEGDLVVRGCVTELDENKSKMKSMHPDLIKYCNGTECNSRPTLQRCIETDPANMEDFATIKLCKEYSDECYLHVANNVARRGCFSDIKDSAMAEDCNDEDICEKCTGIRCNEKQIQKEYCLQCDSENEPLCVEEPQLNMRTECPLAVKPMGCFLFKNGTESTKRGCMSSEIATMRNYCREQGDICKTCMEPECNKKVSFEQCYDCHSFVDGEECINKPQNTNLTTCGNYYDECFTHVTDDESFIHFTGNLVVRGCTKDNKSMIHDNCTSRNCVHCTGKAGCNDIFLMAPEYCIECDSISDNTCLTNITFEASVNCPLAATKKGCYHFIDKNSGLTRRGCMSSLSPVEQKLYLENDDEHKMCLKTNCNNRKSFERCHICNSTSDSNCIILDSTSETKICKYYGDACYTNIGTYAVTRGCLMETTPEFVYRCEINRNKCEECNGEGEQICNRQNVTIEHCIQCDEQDDKNCRDQPTNEVICGSFLTSNLEGCYRHKFFDRIRRGCVHDLTYHHKYYVCLDKRNNDCKTCSGKSCNIKPEFQKCIECSSRDDSNCAEISGDREPIICPNYLDSCFTGIDKSGYTIRKCIPDDAKPTDLTIQSDVCNENGCNNQLFPENRLICHQCSGEGHCDFLPKHLENITIEPRACDVYSKMDKCYTYLDEDHGMHRGCLTDPTESRLMCKENDQSCKFCDENGCNAEPIVRPPTLSCVKCNDATDCAFGHNGSDVTACSMPVLFGTQESCYTLEKENGIVERGCTMDTTGGDPDWCLSNEKCVECNKTGCNVDNVEHQWCVRCDSKMDGDQCIHLTDANYFMNRCDSTNSPYGFDKKGCYTMVQDGVISRGCVKDLDKDEVTVCENVAWCNVCNGKYCNKEQIKSNSTDLLSSGLLVAVSILFQSFFSTDAVIELFTSF